MDFEFSDDQELLRDTAARFIETACPLTGARELGDSKSPEGPDYRHAEHWTGKVG